MPSGFVKKGVEHRIEVNKAEEAKGRKVEVKEANGGKDKVEEGIVGRKEECLESEVELGKHQLKKLLWLEDESLRKQTGRSMKYADAKLPADPCYPLKPK